MLIKFDHDHVIYSCLDCSQNLHLFCSRCMMLSQHIMSWISDYRSDQLGCS